MGFGLKKCIPAASQIQFQTVKKKKQLLIIIIIWPIV